MDASKDNLKRAAPAKGAEAPLEIERRGGGGRVMQPRQVLVYPCQPEGLGRAIRASISDLSATGLGLVCLGSLKVGSRFVLRMNQPNGTPLLQVYHVTRCRSAGGASLIGALFDSVFTGTCPISPASTPAAKTAG
jgi:hypothetical protein